MQTSFYMENLTVPGITVARTGSQQFLHLWARLCVNMQVTSESNCWISGHSTSLSFL
jgi:hypothetical protein